MLSIPSESPRTQRELRGNLASLYLFLLLSPTLTYNALQTLRLSSVALNLIRIFLTKIYRPVIALQEFARHALCQLNRLDCSADRTN